MPNQAPRNSAAIQSTWDLADLVGKLRVSREITHSVRHKGRIRELPSREVLAQIVSVVQKQLE